ncbi:hypothetical protein F4804DRAFT_351855 [Jackrogersella minutella]|nr:hypothetical protein F4804DRAFT_351855 [Jackrogersella minutella]
MTSESSMPNPGAKFTKWLVSATVIPKPSMENPEETKNKVRQIYKKPQPHLDAAAGELAPIFGLGDDLLARTRAQCLFVHRGFKDTFAEFCHNYVQGRWDLPIGEWGAVHKLVHRRNKNAEWAEEVGPDHKDWDVNDFYSRFVIRAFHRIKEDKTALVFWLKEAQLCDAAWVLMHALMYLQLVMMRDCKEDAPMKARITHFIDTWRGSKD